MAEAIEKPGTQANPSDSPDRKMVSSPAATGGAGNVFEQHVGAYWLAQLLVGGIPPILIDCSVLEVNFQTEHLGWQTDDFLVVGKNGEGQLRKLAGQVKRTFTVSAIDEDCRAAILDLWSDFKNTSLFSPSSDRFALITLRGTNTLLEHFVGLLDCARASSDGNDFERRLGTPGFISAKALSYCADVRAIVGEAEGREISAAEIWPFLAILHVLSLDLASGTRQHESMMTSLLAYTTDEPNRLEAAANSWNALLGVVGDGIPSARTFRRQMLPAELQKRHTAGATDQGILSALREHSSLVLDGIHSSVGTGLHLKRAALIQKVIGELNDSQVVLVSGPSGAGKSAVAKDAIDGLAVGYFTFSFRAEEFAQPHFDATLHNSQIPGRAAVLQAALGSQDRKVLLIESVERLLEKSTRDAFTDLLTIAAKDPSLRIILTCRDYSTDLVRSCFLGTAALVHAVVDVPPLTDDELAEVEAAHSSLSIPLANTALRQILRNPYVLDKALRIHWSADRPLPESERDFRALFWQEIIRADQRAADGMPTRRETAFVEVSVRRAQALSVFIDSKDLDQIALTGLKTDSLVSTSDHTATLVAPAHDVLEDWAILRWIEGLNASGEGSFRGLFEAIGTYPALRRGYRKWVVERVEYDTNAADYLFQGAVADESLPASFRDDTLVSLLRAQSSPTFLKRHESELQANQQKLLRRVIHLLRVACVKTPEWIGSKGASLINVPDGAAWAAVLQLVQTTLRQFATKDSLLLLGLIEEWARGVSWWDPYPAGAESAAAIALFLLPVFDNYRDGDERKRTLQVIAKIPKADQPNFEALFGAKDESEKAQNRGSKELQELIFEGMEGMPTARDLPFLLVSVLREQIVCTEADLENEWRYASPLDLEPLFGLKDHLSHGYFPPSAFRTPMMHLLRRHPRTAIDFLIEVFNHSAEWYAHPRVADRVEPPSEIELKFEGGEIKKQWCNPRLWNWYRGTSVGPYVLQSYLMALEVWLFELAKTSSTHLDPILVSIMKRSESGALTAVVASVGTAFPLQCGQALLALLRSRECISLDRGRMAAESATLSDLSGLTASIKPENRIYEEERKGANRLPHRQNDLEVAIRNLQFGPLKERVQEVLDEKRAAMPPIADQNDEDRLWRLAIHRMDMRQYSVSEQQVDADRLQQENSDSSPRKGYVRLDISEPDPDLKEMVEANAPRFEKFQSQMGLLMWGLKAYKREDSDRFDPDAWRERLTQARAAEAISSTDIREMGASGGSGVVAAVCARDHWTEMSSAEQDWCVERICLEIMSHADNWDDTARAQRFGMSADRACSWVIAGLINKPLSSTARQRVREALAVAVTHPVDEVRWYATWGVAEQLWSIDHAVVLRCVNAIATEAASVASAHEQQAKKGYRDRRPHQEIAAEAAIDVRQRFWDADAFPGDAYAQMNLGDWFGAQAQNRILAILGKAPTEEAAAAGFIRASQTLVGWWDRDDDRQNPRRNRNYGAESGLSELIQYFVMQAPLTAAQAVLRPIVDAVDRHPDKLHWFVKGLVVREDSQPNTDQFWALWELFADCVSKAKWIDDLDDEHPWGEELVVALFLGTGWKENVRHWRSVEGRANNLDSLFEKLPFSSTVLNAYLRFLYHIGERSLPGAFIRIAHRLKSAETTEILKKGDTIFMLEALLQRHVYAKPLELKQNQELRNAVLYLLDLLVENGSSSSFRMRDDFVTPVSVG